MIAWSGSGASAPSYLEKAAEGGPSLAVRFAPSAGRCSSPSIHGAALYSDTECPSFPSCGKTRLLTPRQDAQQPFPAQCFSCSKQGSFHTLLPC